MVMSDLRCTDIDEVCVRIRARAEARCEGTAPSTIAPMTT